MRPRRQQVIDRWIAPLAVGVGLALVAALTMTAFVGVGRQAGDALSLQDSSRPGLPSGAGSTAPLLFPGPAEEPTEPAPAPGTVVVAGIPDAPEVAVVDDTSPESVAVPPSRPEGPSEPDDDAPIAAPSGGDDDERELAGRGASKTDEKDDKSDKEKAEKDETSREDDRGKEHPAKSNGDNGKVKGSHGDGKKEPKSKDKDKSSSKDGKKSSADDSASQKAKSKEKASKPAKDSDKAKGSAKPKGSKKGKKNKK